jgi:peptidoglycan hydrolase-like protein with peptidoglycan-binding domain
VGKWTTVMLRPSSLASAVSSAFHSLTRYPFEPPPVRSDQQFGGVWVGWLSIRYHQPSDRSHRELGGVHAAAHAHPAGVFGQVVRTVGSGANGSRPTRCGAGKQGGVLDLLVIWTHPHQTARSSDTQDGIADAAMERAVPSFTRRHNLTVYESGLPPGYVTPEDEHTGRGPAIRTARQAGLDAAHQARVAFRRQLRQDSP